MTGYALDHPLVRDYLRRIDAATAHLAVDEGTDVRQGIRDHLAEALAAAQSDADVRNVLDALGQPEDIVDAPPAQPTPWQPTSQPQGAPPGRGAQEIIAVVLLLIGGFVVPVAGWVVGVVLLWMSKAWTTGQKLLGTLVWPGGLMGAFFALPLLAFVLPFQSCQSSMMSRIGGGGEPTVMHACSGGFSSHWMIWTGMAVAVIAPVVVAIYLLRTAGKSTPAPAPARMGPGAEAPYSG